MRVCVRERERARERIPLVAVGLDVGEEAHGLAVEAVLGLVDHEVNVRAPVHLRERVVVCVCVCGIEIKRERVSACV